MKSAPVSAYAPTSVDRDAARHLEPSPTPSRISTAFAHLVGGHVVEQHDVDAGVARLGHLLERVALDLDDAHRPARAGPLDRLGEAERGEVVVLDQHRVGERLAVVEAAARAHRGLLHAAQAGQRLAGVEDAGLPARGAHVTARQRARRPSSGSRKLSATRSPVSTERSEPAHRADLGAGLDRVAVVQRPLDRRRRRSTWRNVSVDERGAREHTFVPGDEQPRSSIWSSRMHAIEVRSPSRPRSSASAAATTSRDHRRRRIEVARIMQRLPDVRLGRCDERGAASPRSDEPAEPRVVGVRHVGAGVRAARLLARASAAATIARDTRSRLITS